MPSPAFNLDQFNDSMGTLGILLLFEFTMGFVSRCPTCRKEIQGGFITYVLARIFHVCAPGDPS